MPLLEKDHGNHKRGQSRPAGHGLHETTWDLHRTCYRINGKLLLPQQLCNHLGKDGQRRIGQTCQLGFLERKKGSAPSLPKDTKSILVTTSAQSITIPVTLYKTANRKITETTALIDSGATIYCIDLHFAWRMKWPLKRLGQPIYAQNANGTNNKGGMIRYQIDLHLRINERNSIQCFFMMDLGKKNNIILGYPWLTKSNLIINWATGTVTLRGTPTSWHDKSKILEQRYLLWYLWAMEQDNSELAARIYAQQKNTATLQRVLGEDHPHIRKLSLSTALAQATKKVEQKLPPQYAKYAKVFNKPGEGELSPWWPFDHGIDLKETFIPKVAKTYPMNPKEMEACKAFINEHLKSGNFRKSQSLQASLFFFIQKKDGGLHPFQDYWYLNEHTVKNAYPLPLISTLINKLKGAKYFSKMDIWWGYNNICIKEGDEWKAAFTSPLASTSPWSCSSDSATPHQPSRHSWTLPLETWLWKDGWSSTWTMS